MKFPLLISACFGLMSTGGCSGFMSQILDPAISSDNLDEHREMSKVKTLSGDRRLVRIVASEIRPLNQQDEGMPLLYYYDVCAETQADAITVRSATGGLTVANEGQFSDATAQQALLTNNRGLLSDVVRQLSWQLCNARLNDDLSSEDYRKALLDLSHNAMVVLQQIALTGEKAALPMASPLAIVSVVAPTPSPAPSQ